MTKVYKRYSATTDGYRGQRAILKERVIEGLERISFSNDSYQLNPDSPQTIYLDSSSNVTDNSAIILPNAKELWANWKVTIINDSALSMRIYYYRSEEEGSLALFKEVSSGNMITCILIDDSTDAGTWTTLRTLDQPAADKLDRYISDVYEEVELSFGQLHQSSTSLAVSLGTVMAGCPLKSTFIKTSESFAGVSGLQVSIGTADNHTRFSQPYDLTAAVSDTNFTKDIYDEILSTSSNTEIFAYFTGNSSFQSLTAGNVKLVVEKAKLIDPTVLKNPIVQTQLPIGVIMNYSFTDLPEGYWRLDGSVLPNAAASIPQFVKKLNTINNQMAGQKLIVSITEWNQIFSTYGSCGKFAWVGSGLKFPAINHFVQGLTDLTQLSQIIAAGLPNITGGVGLRTVQGALLGVTNVSGAFYGSNAGAYSNPDGGRDTANSMNRTVNFNAANSNVIYGRSNTVQPTSIKYPYIISIYSNIQNSSEIVLDEIIEASVNKANVSLDNLSEAGLNKIRNSVITSWSRNGNGYNRLSNGLIIQWGWNQINTNQSIPISFAIPFSDTYYRVVVSPFTSADAAGNKRDYYWADTYTPTSFNIFASFERTGTAVFTWIAVGF